MTHALVLADIEGIVDIYNLVDIEKASMLYTQEIEVYIKALISSGICKITICDAHNEGNMINPEIINKYDSGDIKISLISTASNISFDEKYDFAIMVGYHGMEGSPGIIPHTYRFDIKEIIVEDKERNTNIPIGEVEVDARWLGSHGVPVILVTGDREAVYEANCFNPYRQTCCVKSAFQTSAAKRASMYEKLRQSLEVALKLDRDLCLSQDNDEVAVEFYNIDMLDACIKKGGTRKNNRVVFKNCADFLSSFDSFIYDLIEISKAAWKENAEFLKEIRRLVKPLRKEDIINSEIGPLLNGSLMTLDKASRDRIMATVKEMALSGERC